MGRWELAVLTAVLATGCHASMSTGVKARVGAQPPAAQAATAPPIQCPESTRWNGEVCVWRYVITEVSCPEGAVWDGTRCLMLEVECPAGSNWEQERCVATLEAAPPAPNAGTKSEPEVGEEIFESRGGTERPDRPIEIFQDR